MSYSFHLLVSGLTYLLVRHIPRWFPGTQFHAIFEQATRAINKTIDAPFDYVKAEMVRVLLLLDKTSLGRSQAKGTARPNLASQALHAIQETGSEKTRKEQIIAEAFGNVYGGTHTSILPEFTLTYRITTASVDTVCLSSQDFNFRQLNVVADRTRAIKLPPRNVYLPRSSGEGSGRA